MVYHLTQIYSATTVIDEINWRRNMIGLGDSMLNSIFVSYCFFDNISIQLTFLQNNWIHTHQSTKPNMAKMLTGDSMAILKYRQSYEKCNTQKYETKFVLDHSFGRLYGHFWISDHILIVCEPWLVLMCQLNRVLNIFYIYRVLPAPAFGLAWNENSQTDSPSKCICTSFCDQNAFASVNNDSYLHSGNYVSTYSWNCTHCSFHWYRVNLMPTNYQLFNP